ncbi:MAG TPA: histidine kinase [Bacillales bacterium]|nr:histidine kinase [Bacillales bacterium]
MPSTQKEKLDAKTLDDVVAKMINTIINSQNQIFEIGESSREQSENILKELKIARNLELERESENEHIETRAKAARMRLAEINKHFDRFGEDEIHKVYDFANQVQSELAEVIEIRQQLAKKRSDLEQQLAGTQETVEHSDTLIGQVSVILNYMNGDLRQIGGMAEDDSDKQVIGLKIIEAQEEERQRLSREIHDGPAQMLAHVLIGSELVERIQKEQGQQAAMEEFNRLRGLIRQALSDVRRIIYDLRPMALDDLGLVPTVEKYLYRIEDREKISIRFVKVGDPFNLSTNMEVALFRLIQETVQNVCKHAQAKEIRVRMEFYNDVVLLVVGDDGKGFDPRERKNESLGIVGMRERIELLEGEMSIQSGPENGTVVTIQIPVQNRGDIL